MYSGEAAEQVVRMSLEGVEVAAKISGEGAKDLALILAAVLKEEHKTKGRAITFIGSLFITIMSFIIILMVYGRFFKLYIYTAISPIPLATFAGEPTQSIGISFLKSYAAVCLEGAIIVLACIIFSAFAASPPVVNEDAAAATMVWAYVGELAFNMLVLVGAIKMSDRVVKE